jgi:hypothetical protein
VILFLVNFFYFIFFIFSFYLIFFIFYLLPRITGGLGAGLPTITGLGVAGLASLLYVALGCFGGLCGFGALGGFHQLLWTYLVSY